MSLALPAGLQDLIRSGNYDAHAALDVTLGDGTTLRMGTAEMLLPGPVAYAPTLRMRGSVKQSLRKVTDMVNLSGQNVDRQLGLTIVEASDALNATRAVFYYVYFALDGTGTVYVVERLEGELTAARVSETEVQLKLVSDLSAGGSVAANRSVMKMCGRRFKGRGCDSTSPDGVCSKDYFDGVNGCASKLPAQRILDADPLALNNQASFAGFIHRSGSGYNTSTNSPEGGNFNGRDPGEQIIGVVGRGAGERFRIPMPLQRAA